MGCDISVGQGTEFIRPDIVESQSQPLFFDSPFIYIWSPCNKYNLTDLK